MRYRWIYILSGILLLLLICGLTLSFYLKDLVNDRIQQLEDITVNHREDALEVALFSRSLIVHDVSLTGSIPGKGSTEFNVSVKAIHLKGVHISDWLFNNTLHSSELILSMPVVNCQLSSDTIPKGNLPDKPSSLSLLIDKVQVNNGKGSFADMSTNLSLIIDQFDLRVEQLRVSQNIWGIDALSVTCNDIQYISTDSIHQISISRIEHSEQQLSIDEIRITPTRDKQTLARALKHRKTMTTMHIPSIVCADIDLSELFVSRPFHVGYIEVDSMNATFYIDKGIPVDLSNYVMLPQEKLRQLDRVLTIDTVELAHAKIRYEEFEPRNGQVGHILFDELNSTISNITNDSSRIEENDVMSIDATALFQGVGALNTKFEFKLTDPGYQYNYTSKLGPMKIAKANTILIPIADLLVESGVNNRVELVVQANNFASLGTLNFDYENLKVRPLNSEHSGLLSKLINGVLVNTNNTRERGKFKEGKVNSERDPTRSITHQIWKAIQSGLATTVLPGILLKQDVDDNH